MDSDQIRILVADDHTVLRDALCEMLDNEDDFEIVARAEDGQSAVRLAATHHPHVVLLDIEMPNHHPQTTVRDLLQQDPTINVVVLSMYDDPHLVQELLGLGIRGYLHKSVTRESLVSAIRNLRQSNRRTVTISVSSHSLAAADGEKLLSARELEVLTQVAAALSNRQIAVRLDITEGTVKRHMRNIFDKLGAVSRIDAVNKAVAASLIGSQHIAGRG
ncbi:response regulator [Kitasatospora kifunensis]|uniref:DNA-binding NarL/FixJ family response regulator n=1 Tax=Kitasatospora kifunensis TaxID=58351 RepID=A0A7W7R376_KITKI|nr:response regulator transcription factor [Kitasatospora kifunensis]MBB4924618.1 DNA-binding NarL/FixJ family response regulator [Kitasatospora kifunensis]